MPTIGQQLKQARNERGLTIEDVAFQTHIPASRVRDMEQDNLSQFANLTYARGFLKLYSEFLELDLSEFLGQFRTGEYAHASGREYVVTASATRNLPTAIFVDHGRIRRPGIYVLAGVAVATAAIIWWNSGRDHKEEDEISAEKNQPAPAAGAVPAAPPSPRATAPAAPPPVTPAPPAPTVAAVPSSLTTSETAEPPPELQPEPVVPPALPTDPANAPEAAPPATPPKAKVIDEER